MWGDTAFFCVKKIKNLKVPILMINIGSFLVQNKGF